MKIIFLLLASLLPVFSWADEAALPAGKWQAFMDRGLGEYAVLIIYIDEKGEGFYGYRMDGHSPASCLSINKSSIQKRDGYFEILHDLESMKLVLLMTEDILNMGYTAMTFLTTDTLKGPPSVWSLAAMKEDFLDQKVYQRCLKETMTN